MMVMIRAVAVAAMATMLAACSITHPNDVAVVSVSKVSKADLEHILGEEAGVPLFLHDTTGDILRVRISTSEDLTVHARDNGSTLGANSSFCNSDRELRTYPSVYAMSRDARQVRGTAEQAPALPTAGSKLHEYDTFTLVWWTRQDDRSSPPYDLASAPQDICLRLQGGGIALKFRSNVVRITREQIRTVLSPARNSTLATDPS